VLRSFVASGRGFSGLRRLKTQPRPFSEQFLPFEQALPCTSQKVVDHQLFQLPSIKSQPPTVDYLSFSSIRRFDL